MRIAAGRPEWMNEVLLGHVAQFVLLAFVTVLTGWSGLIAYICAALVGIISLESVNYIEHYGLVRKMGIESRYQ